MLRLAVAISIDFLARSPAPVLQVIRLGAWRWNKTSNFMKKSSRKQISKRTSRLRGRLIEFFLARNSFENVKIWDYFLLKLPASDFLGMLLSITRLRRLFCAHHLSLFLVFRYDLCVWWSSGQTAIDNESDEIVLQSNRFLPNSSCNKILHPARFLILNRFDRKSDVLFSFFAFAPFQFIYFDDFNYSPAPNDWG